MATGRRLAGHFDEAWGFYRRIIEPGMGLPIAASGVTVSPDGRLAAWTGELRPIPEGRPGSRIFLLDLELGGVRPLTNAAIGGQKQPRWSPDGARVAFIGVSRETGLPAVHLAGIGDGEAVSELEIPGFAPEGLGWTPGGTLLALVAEEGAELGVTSGSGRLEGKEQSTEVRPWWPEVRRGGQELAGWRTVFAFGPDGGAPSRAVPAGTNVWEMAVAGEALLAITSERPSEGDWAHSGLELLALDGSARHRVHRPTWQLGSPAAAPDGDRLAVVEGLASDRGLVAGDILLFEGPSAPPRRVEFAGADATLVQFRDRNHLLATGVRGEETVIAEIDLEGGAVEVHHQGLATTASRFLPEAVPHPSGGALAAIERWDRPPVLMRLRGGEGSALASLSDPGQEWLRTQLGASRSISWTSPDGLRVSGLVVEPPGRSGPHATVVGVHGGPAHRWAPGWPGRQLLYYALLATRGYALFLPNPRGSWGRGQEFMRRELGDYGGGEVQDILSGVDRLVELGVADPGRLGVMGASHGGYMSCWLPTRTRRFRAAVAISPVTDWYSQHFGSNIPDFDEMYLGGEPPGPGGPYFERSPVFFAAASSTPTLLVAGLRDRCTPPDQAVEYHEALLEAGVETELVLYPEEGHGVQALPAAADLAARAWEWFERWIGPGAGSGAGEPGAAGPRAPER